MNTFKFLTLVTLFIGFTSCSNDDDNSTPVLEIESETVSNLHAPQTGGQGTGEDISGEFTKFSFASGTITTSETNWDIAFRGTSIILNGGTSMNTIDEPTRNGEAAGYIVEGAFNEITSINTNLLVQDSEEGYALNGWYTYSGPPNHVIEPIPGRVFVVKTYDGKYAKVEILSYYKDAPNNPTYENEYRYYTFNYLYQPNEGVTTF